MDAPADKVVIMHYHSTLKTTLAKHNSEKVRERVVFRRLALYFDTRKRFTEMPPVLWGHAKFVTMRLFVSSNTRHPS